jgi:putative ABC transport system permease protein
MLLRLARRSLLNRRFAVGLTVCTIALSIGLLVMVEQLRSEVRSGFQRSVAGTDLIVGARTAPLQLLLYSVFGIGDATNNISWETYELLSQAPEVDWALPMALGDAYRGFRVMGTSEAFFDRFQYAGRRSLTFQRGQPFEGLFEVVLGTQVARQLGIELGDALVLSHGTGRVSLQRHDDHPFTVSGILAPTGTPVDQQLYISLAAHHAIHIGWESGMLRPGTGLSAEQAREREDQLRPDSITAVLLGLTTRAAVFSLQRRVNEYRAEPLTAIMPTLTLQELWRITNLAESILRAVSALVVLAGLLGLVTVLLTTLSERRREMAILRANGARPWQIASLLVFEAGLMAALGVLAGVGLALLAQAAAAPWLLANWGVFLSVSWPSWAVWQILLAIWGCALLVALVPALMAYRTTLADGMQVRQ